MLTLGLLFQELPPLNYEKAGYPLPPRHQSQPHYPQQPHYSHQQAPGAEQPPNPHYPNPNEPPQRMISVEYVEDPSSTRLAAHPAPEVLLDEIKPTIGKTMEYQVYMEPTHTHTNVNMNVPEPTRYQPKDYPYGRQERYGHEDEQQQQYDHRHEQQYARQDSYDHHPEDSYEHEEAEEVPAKTVRRTITPGIKPPVKPARKWIW
jgi:hypothetical protein